MDALLQQAEQTIQRTQKFLEDAGITVEEVDEVIEGMPDEIRTVYEQLLAQDQEEAALEWKQERRELMKKFEEPKDSESTAKSKGPRTRIRL